MRRAVAQERPDWICLPEVFDFMGGSRAEKMAAVCSAFPRLPGVPRLVLLHDPSAIRDLPEGEGDLIFSGHMHGGQVALPFFGAILTLSPHGKRFEHGLYEVGPMRLFVSRGLGFEGRAPPIRFCAPPEIAVIDLVPSRAP